MSVEQNNNLLLLRARNFGDHRCPRRRKVQAPLSHERRRPLLESVGATREVMALATCLYTIRWEGRMGTEEVREDGRARAP